MFSLSACAGDGSGGDLVTITDPEKLTLVELPSTWHVYAIDEINGLERVPFVESVQGLEFPLQSVVGFDAAPVEDVENLGTELVSAPFPIGVATVRAVGSGERDFVSRYALTQSVLPYFSLPSAQELSKEDFSFGNGYDGVRVLVSYADATGQDLGVAYMISVTDDDDEQIFSVIAGCSRDCFIGHQQEIEEVVDSWLVNTRA